MARSRLTYSCQSCNINQQQQKRIKSAHTSLLRRMVRGDFKRKRDKNGDETYQFVLLNRKILQICGTEDLVDYVKLMQENYLGHIE